MFGRLRLTVGLDTAGRCSLREQFSSNLHRVLRLIPGDAPHQGIVYLLNPAGGVVQGDSLEADVSVHGGAHAIVTSPGATKVYRMERSGAASRTRLRVERGGFLEYLPEPLIPHAGARFVEDLTLDVAEGAGTVAWEMIAPGRTARGESLEYERLSLRLLLRDEGQAVLRERGDLAPSEGLTGSIGLGRWTYYGIFLAVGESAETETRLRECVSNAKEVHAGVTRLRGRGIMMKALATESRRLAALFHAARESVVPALTGRAAVAVRKT